MSAVLQVFLGIDGGATGSRGAAIDLTGRVLATAQSGSLNFFGTSLRETRRHLKELVKILRRKLPLTHQFMRIVIGSAALNAEATEDQKEKFCRGLLPLERTRMMSDCVVAYYGACLDRPGILVNSGTGSFVLGRTEAGQFMQVGGWGHLLGDEGSAFWLGLGAIQAAIAASEGRAPATRLTSLVCEWFKVKELLDTVPLIYNPLFAKERLAGLAQFLAEHDAHSEPVYRSLCLRAGEELAQQTLAAASKLNLALTPVPICPVGGVLQNNRLVRESLVANLQASLRVKIETSLLPPALGAAALALVDGGLEFNDDRLHTMQATYRALQP